METINLFFFCGVLGAIAIVAAYFLIQLELLDARSYGTLSLNVGGALLVLVSLYDGFNLGSLIIQLAWIAIGLAGVYKKIKRLAWGK